MMARFTEECYKQNREYRMIFNILFVLSFAILSIYFLLIPDDVQGEQKVQEYVLKNGLKVIILKDHKAPVATFQIWYRVGSIDEPKGKTGLSHLFEHMAFRGTPKYGSKELSRLIQKNGGIDNAYTTKDYTAYFQILPSDRIDLSIEIEADRMRNLLLREEDLQYERAVVMEERRLRYEDDPEASLFEEVQLTAFKAHPYRWPVIGMMSDLLSITREDLISYYRRFYNPSNAFIIVAGDVNPEEMIKKIKEFFEQIPEGESPERHYSEEPPQRGERRIYLKKEAEIPYLLIAYHVPSFPHTDAPALEVLSSILTGKSGRLYKEIISKKRIAASVDASYSGLNRFPYLFFFDGIPLEGKDVKELEEAIYEVIEDIIRTPPSEREIEKAKNQIEAALIMEMDSVYSMARIMGTFELLGGWHLKDRYLEKIREVRPEDVQRVASKYLIEDNRTVGILVPINLKLKEERKN
ncbi:MAG: insulinase family protein [Thermodesulfovibrionales bacterium]|nr:insulinase family protein [Thermodesulfovibrionales bacterium]